MATPAFAGKLDTDQVNGPRDEELEWDALLTRARAAVSQPQPSLHDGGRSPLDFGLIPGTMRLDRPTFMGGAAVAWP